jgi:predicted DNA-binding transcriptional regulator YafY
MNRRNLTMTSPSSRLITLIMLLQRRPNQKAAELAKALDISVRTLHRYFEQLDEMGIPVYAERGPYGGFSLVRGYKMPPLVLTPEEAVASFLGLSLVEEMWGQLYRSAGVGAMAKLENLLPDEQRQEIAWARRSLLATGLHRSDQQALAATLDKLRSATREHRRVHMSYQGREPSTRNLDPYALVHRSGWWYVIGYCHLRKAMRTFRIDRINNLEVLENGFSLPADFDLQAYLALEPQMQPAVRAHLRFNPQFAGMARNNRPFWENLEERPDGAVDVTFQAPDLEWAASTALAYGPAVEVLEPPELRRMVVGWAGEVAELYK